LQQIVVALWNTGNLPFELTIIHMKLQIVLFLILIQAIVGYGAPNCLEKAENYGNMATPERITLLWETSFSMRAKNMEKELDFINVYFEELSSVEVSLVVFSNDVLHTEVFHITEGNSQSLQHKLRSFDFDGFPEIPAAQLKEVPKPDRYLFFTNGLSYSEQVYLQFDQPVIVVNSLRTANRSRLHNLSYHTYGRFLDLDRMTISEALENIQPGNVLLKRFVEAKEIKSSKNVVSGIVADEKGPLPNVNIWVKERSLGTMTNSNGEYSIIAKPGDILAFSHLNKQTILVEIDKANEINVLLPSTIESLDAVLITAKKVAASEKTITAYGLKDRNTVGVAVETVNASDIQPGKTTLTEALVGKFRGIKLEDASNIASAIVREARVIPLRVTGQRGSGGGASFGEEVTSQYPIFFYDGTPLPRYSKKNKIRHDFINPDNIKSVTVLKGLAATNRFGSMGSNGVILIATYMGDTGGDVPIEKKKYTPPKLKKFSGSLDIASQKELSRYGKLILNESGHPDYKKYLSFRDRNEENLTYYFETAEAFHRSGDTLSTLRILSTIRAVFPENTSALHALAYVYTELGNFNMALDLYEHILEVSPTAIQHYRDLAMAYGKAGEHRKAIKAFEKLLQGKTNSNLDFSLQNDANIVAFKHLLQRRNHEWYTREINKDYFTPATFDLRIELHWTSYDARFNLNIIKPNKDLLYWQHNEANEIDLTSELAHGITSKQINFFKAEKGIWYFNIDQIPTEASGSQNYLHITLYTNYGKPNETKTSQIIKIEPSQNGQTFAKVVIQ
jgi:tetratricopeptide (TPR) repeat protein